MSQREQREGSRMRKPLRVEIEPTMLQDGPPHADRWTVYLFAWEIGKRHRRRTVIEITGRTEHEAEQALLAYSERPDVTLLS